MQFVIQQFWRLIAYIAECRIIVTHTSEASNLCLSAWPLTRSHHRHPACRSTRMARETTNDLFPGQKLISLRILLMQELLPHTKCIFPPQAWYKLHHLAWRCSMFLSVSRSTSTKSSVSCSAKSTRSGLNRPPFIDPHQLMSGWPAN